MVESSVLVGKRMPTAAGYICPLVPHDGKSELGAAWYSKTYSQWQAVWAHKMGHGYGLPHSGSRVRGEYNNDWDVMGYPYNAASTYTWHAQHTIAYHKDLLGWLGAGKYVHAGGTRAVTLHQLGTVLPAGSTAFHMAQIPVRGGSRFYTVEVRNRIDTGPYEALLCYGGTGPVVIIHEVDPTRNAPAYVIDSDNNGETCDAGAMWTRGESFRDQRAGITVRVDSVTATGAQVTISTR